METCLGKPHRVILYRNDLPVLKGARYIKDALHCCTGEAVHIQIMSECGQAVVWTGSLERCELILSILEGYGLRSLIEPVKE